MEKLSNALNTKRPGDSLKSVENIENAPRPKTLPPLNARRKKWQSN
jgi:hypothetical protein